MTRPGYAVTGTQTEDIRENSDYWYLTNATVTGGAWVVTGSANLDGDGRAEYGYSGSGSYSDSFSFLGLYYNHNSTLSEHGSDVSSYDFALNFDLQEEGWVPTQGHATTTVSYEDFSDYNATTANGDSSSWGNADVGGFSDEDTTVTLSRVLDIEHELIKDYQWSPTSGAASGSGSASGSSSPWKLTQITETGDATLDLGLDYAYSGECESWDLIGPTSGTSRWELSENVYQESHSEEHLNKTTTFTASGQATTTGSDARLVSSSGTADRTYDSEWTEHRWSSSSGSTYHLETHDDYDYDYSRTETFNASGGSTVNESETNHVTGTLTGSSSHWWTFTSGSASGGGPWTTSGSTSASWSDSYDETVDYPGFYQGAYYSGDGDHLGYIGDAFHSGSGWGWGAYSGGFFALEGGEMMMRAAAEPSEPLAEADVRSPAESDFDAVWGRWRGNRREASYLSHKCTDNGIMMTMQGADGDGDESGGLPPPPEKPDVPYHDFGAHFPEYQTDEYHIGSLEIQIGTPPLVESPGESHIEKWLGPYPDAEPRQYSQGDALKYGGQLLFEFFKGAIRGDEGSQSSSGAGDQTGSISKHARRPKELGSPWAASLAVGGENSPWTSTQATVLIRVYLMPESFSGIPPILLRILTGTRIPVLCLGLNSGVDCGLTLSTVL